MKKLILLSAVLFGTAVASQAGVHVDLGFRLPLPPIPLPGRVIISRPAPPVYYSEPEYCEPPQVIYAPPRVVYVPSPSYYSYPSYRSGYSRWDNRGHYGRGWDNYGCDNRGGHRH
ncbi:MAG: hypothetical protein ABIQ35_03160 [Verrucomicrobiota bacterium]